MKICGVELTGNEAVICLLSLDNGQFNLPDCRARKLALPKKHSQAEMVKFQSDFAKLMQDYGVDTIVIKERLTRGKFSGGALSFKMESAIQLIKGLDVSLLNGAETKAILSDKPLPITFEDTGLKVFQKSAFTVAYAALVSQ
uniref:DUF3010 domain-containing protein n=1 Tax=uncultured Thiotrichaceae bacterium TaxID=298394 RepID=A0A6S6UGB0_9GAMM|nr:MAG: Unknown protein [uncultured Thiotrichaceae bacterium]